MSDPFVGEIRTFAFPFAPINWAFCNGQILPASQNTALFAILGRRFGGRESDNTFALPNLQATTASGGTAPTGAEPTRAAGYLVMNFCISLRGVMPPR